MARSRRVVTIDFETEAIQGRPAYPPKPVGVAIWEQKKEPIYIAWGHPTENGVWERYWKSGKAEVKRKKISATPEEYARRYLKDLWEDPNVDLLGHNSMKFDMDVAETHLDLPYPDWRRQHDTLFTLYLRNPHAFNLQLKHNAEEILGMKPEERDEVNEWLAAHGFIKKPTQKDAGAYICKAPGNIVGKYAIGDGVRTYGLHEKCFNELDDGERAAYDRERRLAPILLRNEREGMRVDFKTLNADIELYSAQRAKCDAWIRKRLQVPDSFNIDSDRELAEALESNGIVTDFVITKSGQKSVSKDNLTKDMYKDQSVWLALNYRNRLCTALGTFMMPWSEMAEKNNGYIFTSWNQVRGSSGGGTRTGRLSCSPNFMNIPKSWEEIEVPEDFEGLPLLRRYILPDKGHWFGHRDYNQQEFRILAHFENDVLMKSYLDNPYIDYHDNMKRLVLEMTGMDLDRRTIKTLNFGINYGMGIGKLALRLDVPVATAKALLQTQKKAAPGVAALNQDLCSRGKRGEAIRTWGGRLYYCEAPGWSAKFKKMMSFEYKLLNYLIQGSAADCTKESLIRYSEVVKDARFIVTVHDEINISAPKGAMKQELMILREAMESVGVSGSDRWGDALRFDVPMISDAKMGKNWAQVKKFDEPERKFAVAA